MRRLIVNADDLGRSRRINDAIFAAMARGAVTSATVMANGEAFEHAVAEARRFPQCSFGAHLTLTWGRPVGPPDRLGRLLDADGRFTRQVWSPRWTADERRAVADEWCLQVEALRAAGLEPSHLDSHEHVHTIPPLFTALCDVVGRTGIRRVRLTKNLYCGSRPPAGRALLIKKRFWAFALRWRCGAQTTDYFTDLHTVAELAREEMLPLGTIEAMVHPGHDDPDFEAEMQTLLNGFWQHLAGGTSSATYRAVGT